MNIRVYVCEKTFSIVYMGCSEIVGNTAACSTAYWHQQEQEQLFWRD
jgi:hypothetical protein